MPSHIQIGDVAPRIQYAADGSQVAFTYPFAVFEDANMFVFINAEKQEAGYTVTNAGNSFGGEVVFDAPPPSNTIVTLTRHLDIERTSDFQESGEFRSKVLNDELDYQTAALQQLDADYKRSLHISAFDTTNGEMNLPVKEQRLGKVLAFDDVSGLPIVSTESLANIEGSATYASAAASSASAAATSASSAQVSQANAAASASAAATAAASNMFSSNESKTGNFSVSGTDDGKQFLIDTSAGGVTVTLPEGTSATDAFRVALAKVTADSNVVTVNTSGTDTINGGTTWQFSVPYGQVVVTLDTTPSPDVWFAAGVGVAAIVGVNELHENAKPYDMGFYAGYDHTFVAQDIVVQTYAKLTLGHNGKFVGAHGNLQTAPVGSYLEMDILKNGVSIYTIKPWFTNGTTTLSSGILKSDGTEQFVAGDEITFKITNIGSIIPGAGLTFTPTAVIT